MVYKINKAGNLKLGASKKKNNFDKALWQNALFFFIIFIAFAVVYFSSFKINLDLNGDNASYYLLGKSLSMGEGYNIYSDLNAKPHNHFPPGYPFIIAILMLFSKNVLWLKIANGIFFLSSLLLSFQVFRKFEVKWQIALVSVLFMLVNFHLVKSSTIIMSEIPYLFFVMLSLWLLIKIDFSKKFWQEINFYYFIMVLSFSFHIRTIGIALFVGILFYLLLEKQWKAIIAVFTGFILLAMPWILRGKILGLSSSYQKQLLSVNPYQLELGNAGLLDFFERFGGNINRYLSKEIPISLLSFLEVNYKVDSTYSAYVIGLGLTFLCFLGIYLLPKYRSLVIGYLGGSFFILMLWPKVWSGARFILPLIPILIFLIVLSSSWLLEKGLGLFNFRSNYFPLLLLPLISLSLQKHQPNQNINYQSYPLSRLFKESKNDYPPNWKNYIEIAKYTKNNLPKGEIIACRKPQLFHIFSNRFTSLYPYLEDDQELLAILKEKKVKYVVVDQLGYSSTSKYLVPAVNKNFHRFKVLLHLKNPDTYLLELLF